MDATADWGFSNIPIVQANEIHRFGSYALSSQRVWSFFHEQGNFHFFFLLISIALVPAHNFNQWVMVISDKSGD